uniref:Uncharacterized protein n=1 Tax=Mycobacterium sp. (strain KMS) TaxID=189918 RepID=A1ULD5_MYCSK
MLVSGGVVTICVLPPVSHCVVRGPVFTHSGAAVATGAVRTVAPTIAKVESVVAVGNPMDIGDLQVRPGCRGGDYQPKTSAGP